MASSSTSLTRAKSLRKSDVTDRGLADAADRGESTVGSGVLPPRNVSPSRLPMKPSTWATRPLAGSEGTVRDTALSDGVSRTAKPKSTASGRSTVGAGTRGPPSSAPGDAAAGPPINGTRGLSPRRRFAATTTRPPSAGSGTSRNPRNVTGAPTTASSQAVVPSTITSTSGLPARTLSYRRVQSSAVALTSATVLRPPSSQGRQHAPAASAERDAAPAATTRSRSRPPITRDNARPGLPAHRRSQSGSVPNSSTVTTARPPSAAERRRPSSRSEVLPAPTSQTQRVTLLQRPTFSTLQQHYSPAKNPHALKPTTAAILAPPSPSRLPANIAAQAEAARTQAELLRLYLVHSQGLEADQQWREDARQKLMGRFEKLKLEAEAVERQEKEVMEVVNAKAFKDWEETGSSLNLEEKVQLLDNIVSGVWATSDSSGKFAKVVRRFERWLARVEEVLDARRQFEETQAPNIHAELLYFEQLDQGWKNDCAGITRKLQGWELQLRELGQGRLGHKTSTAAEVPASGLARMVDGFRHLVESMLGELEMMESMEREALEQQSQWIRRMINTDDNEEDKHDTPRESIGVVWRTV